MENKAAAAPIYKTVRTFSGNKIHLASQSMTNCGLLPRKGLQQVNAEKVDGMFKCEKCFPGLAS